MPIITRKQTIDPMLDLLYNLEVAWAGCSSRSRWRTCRRTD